MLSLFGDDDADRLRKLVDRTPVTAVGDLAPGPAAVEGTVRRHREAVDHPLEDGEAVFARYRKRRRSGGRFSSGEVVETRTDTVPFVVEDETGEVLVDARDAGEEDAAAVLVSAGNTDRYFGDEDGDQLVPITGSDETDTEQIATARGELGETPEWIHVQSVICPGDEVYVLGRVDETPGGSPPHVVSPADDGTFLLSDMSQSALIEQLKRAGGPIDWRFWAFAIIGAIIAVGVLVVIGALADSFLL